MGSVQKCALEAGFHPGDWFEGGLEPRVTNTLQFTLCLYISASVLLQNLVFYSILWGWRARGCVVGGRAGCVQSERLRPDFAGGDGVGGCARMDGRRVRLRPDLAREICRRVCADGWSEGAREASKNARLRPDSTREIGLRAV